MIGRKPVIIIRNAGKQVNISQSYRIDLLVKTIKDELVKTIKDELIKTYDIFMVKIIQVFYDDNYELYQSIKEEIITDKVCI